MKRLLAILLCLSLMITSLCSIVVFAEDSSDNSGSSESAEQETVSEYDHNDNDLVDGLMFPDGEDLTRADKMALINSASLEPTVTHYNPLDTLVSSVLSEITTPDMVTIHTNRRSIPTATPTQITMRLED